MPQPPLAAVVRHVHGLIAKHDAEELTDRQLLERFITGRDEAAFAALLRRHGGMVLGVGRRILADVHAAEDVFQATFLLLASRAASIRKPDSLGCWLYGAARRLAERTLAQAGRRRARERRLSPPAQPDAVAELSWRELSAILDEELHRLPEKLCSPLLLCYLEGRTQDEAARHLGWSKTTLRRRLDQARQRLHARLVRRGVSLSVGLLATALAQQSASAALSPMLVKSTLQAALTAGRNAAATASTLGTTAVLLPRLLKLTAALVLMFGVVAAGAGYLSSPSPMPESDEPAVAKPAQPLKPAEEKHVRADFYGDPLPEGVLARMGTTRLRHWPASQLFFSPDNKTLVSFGSDRTVRSWDMSTGKLKQMQRLALPTGCVIDDPYPKVSLSPDAKTAALLAEKELLLWDVADGKVARRLPLVWFTSDQISVMAFAPDGKTLALGKDQDTVVIWDVATGKERSHLTENMGLGMVLGIAFSPDGQTLAASRTPGGIDLWDLAKGKRLRTIPTKKGDRDAIAFHLAFAPDGKTLVAPGAGFARLYNVATGNTEVELSAPNLSALSNVSNTLVMSPDGKTLAHGNEKGIVLRDRHTGKEIRSLSNRPGGLMRFSQDGKVLAMELLGGIRLWDVDTGKPLHATESHTTSINSIAYSPDGKRLASAAKFDDTIRFWDAATGKPLHVITKADGWITQLIFSSDGKTLISVGQNFRIDPARPNVCLWDVATGKERGKFHPYEHAVNDVRVVIHDANLSADGKKLSALSGEYRNTGAKGTLTTWEVATGKRILQRDNASQHGSFFSSDGKLACLDPGDHVVIHDIKADRVLTTLPGHSVCPAALSPDGKIAAVSGIEVINNPANPEEAKKEELRRRNGENQVTRLWDVSTGKEMLKIATGSVYFRAFSPDGRFLVTVGLEDLRLWESATGKEVLRRPNPGITRGPGAVSFANCLAVAPDGRSVATGHSDTNVLVWDLAPATRQKSNHDARDLDRLWSALAGDDAAQAYHAAGTLIAAPDQALPFLRQHIQPATEDVKKIAQLIADLDSEQFAVREAARKGLQDLGEVAEPALRKVLESNPSAEARKSINALLPIPWVPRSVEVLRQIRAVHVLEQIGTSEAKVILERLATGAPGARQTRDAKAALARSFHHRGTENTEKTGEK